LLQTLFNENYRSANQIERVYRIKNPKMSRIVTRLLCMIVLNMKLERNKLVVVNRFSVPDERAVR